MAISWNDDQRALVERALHKYSWKGDRCAAAARAVLPVAKEIDRTAYGLLITGRDEAPFILTKEPKRRKFDYHVLVEAEEHRVDAITGADGWNAAEYLNRYWQYPKELNVEPVDVYTVDVGIEGDGEES
jgi:hypothetical protein